jgi:hypothetical protein
MSSHAADDAAGVTWPRRNLEAESCWRQRCRGDLAAARCRCRVMLATMRPSHAGIGVAEVTWPRRDIGAESC